MVQNAQTGVPCDRLQPNCPPDKFGCPSDQTPDFSIKRHDTRPPFRVMVDECEGPIDLTDENLIVEVSMWAKGKIKKDIDNSIDFFRLADDIGFEQIMVGDIIVMERVRMPERMLVIAFDEVNKLVQVQRGYQGTQAVAWKKGSSLRIFRIINASGIIETELDDVLQVDGTTSTDQVTGTFIVYEWHPNDTCLPGCYWLEFKLLKITEAEETSLLALNATSVTPSIVPSFTPSTLSAGDFGCILGEGIEWCRRFPICGEGFLIRIIDSPTMEI